MLFGVFVLLKAAAYWVDRYGIDFSQRGVVRTGASYTDVNAILPAKTVLAVIAVLCAVLFFAGAIRRNTLLPAVGFGLLVLSAVLIGGVYPAIIQQFVVKPNEQVKESPYISREIKYTRLAYGVSNVRNQPYQAGSSLPAADLGRLVSNLPDVRLMDPAVVSQTFQQLQQVKGYYKFPGVLAVDRYPQPGSAIPQDTVIGVRDMDGPPSGQANWINSHLVYTHGFGVVAARASTAQANTGAPAFTESDIPPTGSLGLKQPRIYFGQQETSYAIVGGRQAELDYPNGSTGGQQNTRYTGGGGVPVGSPLNRLLYAIKFRQLNILLSGAIDGNSKIMYIRDPLSRVQKVAPFLTLDGDPYPVVWNGGIDWVVDAYTTTNDYPYSQRIGLRQASTDSYFPSGSVFGSPGQVNYVRNSVKAVVDAYTGKVTLYQWGTKDPILQTWMQAFPGVIQPRTDIPPALLAHLRYPEVLFEAQRQILAQYHVQQAEQFYGGQNFWTVPDDPSRSGQAGLSQPPYYLTLSSMPGYKKPEFSLVTSFNPRGRPNMAAFMAVEQQPGEPRLRHDPAAGTAAGHRVPRARAGAERLRVRPDRGLRADPAAPGRLPGHHRQPGHAPGRRRPGLLRAAVRVAVLRQQQLRLVPDPETGPGVLQRHRHRHRQHRLRADAERGAGPGLHGPRQPAPAARQHRRRHRPAVARRHRELHRAEVPAAGRELLQPGPDRAEERRPGHIPGRSGQGQGGAGQGAAGGRGRISGEAQGRGNAAAEPQ